MASFFAKVGRTLHLKKKSIDRSGDKNRATLLDGQKYEAVAVPDSPSARTFQLQAQEHHPAAQDAPKFKLGKTAPLLSLNLDDSKETGEKDSTFDAILRHGTAPAIKEVLDWKTLDAKQLSIEETLALVEGCSQSVKARGLETLGIMHPHWHSNSPKDQRTILTAFFTPHSGEASKTTNATFMAELQHARTPRDPAAVLRWALRHLNNGKHPFGSSSSTPPEEWGWYKTFSKAERDTSFPPNAYGKVLVPALASPNARLLATFLDLASHLASQSELNGISGSKFCKLLGYWLLSTRVKRNGWKEFYDDWDAAGRILEHLFLAYLRDETIHPRLPRRLLDLVSSYPYSPQGDGIFLAKPRFTTRTYEALYVQLELKRDAGQNITPRSAQELVEEAIRTPVGGTEASENGEFWKSIQDSSRVPAAAFESPEQTTEPNHEETPQTVLDLTQVFTDDTLNLFYLQAHGLVEEPGSPALSIMGAPLSFVQDTARRRALSLSEPSVHIANGHSSAPSAPSTYRGTKGNPTLVSTGLGADWASFSTSGFFDEVPSSLAETLLDKDTEVSAPPQEKPSLRHRLSIKKPAAGSAGKPNVPRMKDEVSIAQVDAVAIDEAFIDFWSDALGDPVSSAWPSFAVGQLRPGKHIKNGDRTIQWVIVEGKHTVRAPPPPPPAPQTDEPPRSPAPSMTSMRRHGSAKKLFGLFRTSSSRVPSSPSQKRPGSLKSLKISELGEVEESGKSLSNKGVKETQSREREEVAPVVGKPTKEDDATTLDELAAGRSKLAAVIGDDKEEANIEAVGGTHASSPHLHATATPPKDELEAAVGDPSTAEVPSSDLQPVLEETGSKFVEHGLTPSPPANAHGEEGKAAETGVIAPVADNKGVEEPSEETVKGGQEIHPLEGATVASKPAAPAPVEPEMDPVAETAIEEAPPMGALDPPGLSTGPADAAVETADEQVPIPEPTNVSGAGADAAAVEERPKTPASED